MLLALGDSFVAGHGLRSIDDRFQNKLVKKIADDWIAVTLAEDGWDTEDELKALRTSHIDPDVLVLGYYINDIKGVMLAEGLDFEVIRHVPAFPLNLLIEKSYFLNYVYWKWARARRTILRFKDGSEIPYLAYMHSLYNDLPTLLHHYNRLNEIIQFCNERNVPMILVFFPELTAVEHFLKISDHLEKFCIRKGVIYVDVGDLVKEIPKKQRIVNPWDHHASKLVHSLLSDTLAQFLATETQITILSDKSNHKK